MFHHVSSSKISFLNASSMFSCRQLWPPALQKLAEPHSAKSTVGEVARRLVKHSKNVKSETVRVCVPAVLSGGEYMYIYI